jgi:hypothetical protein
LVAAVAAKSGLANQRCLTRMLTSQFTLPTDAFKELDLKTAVEVSAADAGTFAIIIESC